MHPVLARFLDLGHAQQAVRKIRAGASLDAAEQALAKVIPRDPDKVAALLEARGAHPSEEAQAALVFLAAHAALEALREAPAAAAALTRADLSLRGHGGSDAQVSALLASVLVEEAFGYEDSADSFDLPFVLETFEGLPKLLGLEPLEVDRIVARFVESAPKPLRTRAEKLARRLLEAAWGEGPEPINPEHVQIALEDAGTEDTELLAGFLNALGREGLVGPLRLARLVERL
jgi:hypothetical protein